MNLEAGKVDYITIDMISCQISVERPSILGSVSGFSSTLSVTGELVFIDYSNSYCLPYRYISENNDGFKIYPDFKIDHKRPTTLSSVLPGVGSGGSIINPFGTKTSIITFENVSGNFAYSTYCPIIELRTKNPNHLGKTIKFVVSSWGEYTTQFVSTDIDETYFISTIYTDIFCLTYGSWNRGL